MRKTPVKSSVFIAFWTCFREHLPITCGDGLLDV